MKVKVIIPAYNEESAIGLVLNEIPKSIISEVIVIDNNSTDDTAKVAKTQGATVLFESKQGYGSACLKGLEYLSNSKSQTDIVVFIDGDHSDYPDRMPSLIKPIIDEDIDMVIGSRALGNAERGSMTVPQVFGNWLATRLIKLFFKHHYSDLGPFRAIKYEKLLEMNMQDVDYGWTVEMQVKAAKLGFKTTEVAVPYRRRIGFSKISGTVKGTISAGYKILYTIFKYM